MPIKQNKVLGWLFILSVLLHKLCFQIVKQFFWLEVRSISRSNIIFISHNFLYIHLEVYLR